MRKLDLATVLSIKNKSELDEAIEIFLENLSSNEYDIRESYEYTMCLPESYYGTEGSCIPTSYDKWFRVRCALIITLRIVLVVSYSLLLLLLYYLLNYYLLFYLYTVQLVHF